MINIYPVWEQGFFGSGIRIRVNDQGEVVSDEFLYYSWLEIILAFFLNPTDWLLYNGV